MHRSLQLNLSKLPLSLRTTATAATSGSREDLRTLVEKIPDLPAEHLPFLLPVFYSGLECTDIPAILEQLDVSSPRVENIAMRITQVIFCLQGTSYLGIYRAIRSDAIVDLWRRVWPWIEFLDQYQDYLQRTGIQLLDLYSLCMSLFRIFRENEGANKLLDSTEGPHAVAGRAWRHLIHAKEDEGFSDMCYFLSAWFRNQTWDPVTFEALVAGAGGTRNDLASLVLLHLDRLFPSHDTVVTSQTLSHVVGILYLVGKIGREWDLALRDALLAQGIVTALTNAGRALSSCPLPVAEIEMKSIFTALVDDLACFPRHRRITDSLRAGLLHVIFNCGSARHRQRTGAFLRYLLQDILPPATVYHSVLTQLRLSLAEVCDRDATAVFADPEILKHWLHFVELVEKRLQVVDLYNMGSLGTTTACNSLKCARISAKYELQRCSGCSLSYYCSRTCQTDDWRYGGHRERCRALSSRGDHPSMFMSARDRSFLRMLVHHDYIARREDIALDHLFHMQGNLGPFLPYTLFDYSEGTCEVQTRTCAELDPSFLEEAVRSAASGGRMQLHLVKVLDGKGSATWSIPLRSASGDVVQGLTAIARAVPPDAVSDEDLELYRPAIQNLLNLNVQVTH
ncbi:hypothetical protein DFH06DRAFT_1483845 [Mycena polygramma]|nr:hypothetical protein DFH06DRAFT_1483845 [Mycena polygramma]